MAGFLLCWAVTMQAEYAWPEAPPEQLKEDIFGIRFRLALREGGPKAAEKLLRESLRGNPPPHVRAYVAWVSLFPEGWGLPALVEPAVAEQMAAEAVAAGSRQAADTLGRARIYGQKGIERDVPGGLKLLESAVQRGLPRAIAQLAAFQVRGEIMPRNVAAGALAARRAAALGSLIGLEQIAEGFERGWISGSVSNPVAMEYYFRMALYNDRLGWQKLEEFEQAGVANAHFYRALAYVTQANDGGELPPSRVRQHVETLKKLEVADPRKWLELGVAHLMGEYARRDYPQAITCFKRAAGLGSDEAKFFLAFARLRGWGVPREAEPALAEMRALADAGNARAATHLGYLYYWGSSDLPGKKKEEELAFKYTRIGAEAGYGWAINNLAFCYQHGIGVRENPTLAAKLYWEAYNQGFSLARERLQKNLAYSIDR